MSVADLKAYGKRAATDPVVRARAKEIGLQNIAGQAAYAKTLGFTFSAEDMAQLAKESTPKGELSDDQLKNVAGGVVTTTVAVIGGWPGPGPQDVVATTVVGSGTPGAW